MAEMADRRNAISGQSDKALADFDPPKPKGRNKYAIICGIVASMTSILLGYDLGVMTGAVIFIQRDLKISDVEVEFLAGTLNIYCLAGSCIAGRFSDWLGRRITIGIAGVIFFVGAILMGLAPNYPFLMFGRFVAGIGVGFALMVAPVYTAEVAPASARGFLSSFPEVFINGGILLGYVANFAFKGLPQHLTWRFMLGVCAIPSIFITLSALAMPESPRWLVMRGRLAEAKKVLDKTSDSKEEAKLRLHDIKENVGIPDECDDDVVEVQRKNSGGGVWKELLFRPTPAVRHMLLAGIGVHFFQQASGMDSIVLYSPRIFLKAGITSENGKLLSTCAVGLVKTVSILIATFFVDRFGRRKLLLVGCGGMVLSLFFIATSLMVIDNNPGDTVTWAVALCITTVMTFVASFSMGIGPTAWIYNSEIFPLRLRAQGTSLGVALNRLTSGIVGISFLSLYKAITISGAFYLYMGIAAVGWLYIFVLLPETKGRTLEDMEGLFGDLLWKFHKTNRATSSDPHTADDQQT